MAINKTLTIEIKVKDETSGGTNTSNSDVLEPSSAKPNNSEQDVLGSEKLMKDPTFQQGEKAGQVALTAAKSAMNIIIGEAAFQIDYMFATNDDYIGQRNLQVASQYINAATNAATTIGSMAMIGGVAGAVVGAAIVVANTAQQNKHAQQMEDLSIRQMETSLDFTRSRAGKEYSTRAASIGEDL